MVYRISLLLVFCLAVGFSVMAQDLTSGLEMYLKFDEGSGEVASDSSGKGHDASFRNGDPMWVDGIQGAALDFDGDDDLTTVGWHGIEGDNPRTVSYWIKTDWAVDASSGTVGWGFSTENGQKWHTRLNNTESNGTVGAIRTEIQGNYFIGSTPVNNGQWHHLVSVFPEGGTVMTDVVHYVDGVEEVMSGTNTANADILVNTAGEDTGTEVEIGSRLQGEANQFFIGTVDEVRIYSRGLSASDVLALFISEGGQASGVPYYYMLY